MFLFFLSVLTLFTWAFCSSFWEAMELTELLLLDDIKSKSYKLNLLFCLNDLYLVAFSRYLWVRCFVTSISELVSCLEPPNWVTLLVFLLDLSTKVFEKYLSDLFPCKFKRIHDFDSGRLISYKSHHRSTLSNIHPIFKVRYLWFLRRLFTLLWLVVTWRMATWLFSYFMRKSDLVRMLIISIIKM